MRRLRPTIRLRLTAWYAGIFFLLGAALLAVAYGAVRESFDRAAASRSVQIQQELETPKTKRRPRTLSIRIAPGLPESDDAVLRTLSAEEREVYARARRTIVQADRKANAQAKRRVLLQFSGALAVLTLLSLALGWLVAGRVLRPIARITETAQRISDRTLHERIALGGPRDELRELADTFDGMLERLDSAFRAHERFVANASHELRTPLAIVRTELDVTLADPEASRADLRQMAEVVRDANLRMERLIEGLLTLATSGAGALDRRPADVAGVTALALDRVPDGLVAERSLGPAPVFGDPVLLERVAANLVENAARYNLAEGGWIRVRTGRHGSWAELVVVNAGPPVDPGAVAGLFEPFRRVETSRARATGGYGLGLAIVRSVAEAHGGTATAEALPEGGLAVRVRIPLAEQAAEVPELVPA